VVFTHGLRSVVTRTALAALTTGTFVTTTAIAAFATIAAAFTTLATGLLIALFRRMAVLLMSGPFVRVDGGIVMTEFFLRRGFFLGQNGLFAFSEAQDALQTGFDAAEQRRFFRGVIGTVAGGHERAF
jgi:hypothetical protein